MKKFTITFLITFSFFSTLLLAESDIALGKAVHDRLCAKCHGVFTGYKMEAPLRISSLLNRKDLSPDSIRYFVRNGLGMMPFLKKTDVSDKELDALVKYLMNTIK